MMLDLNLTRHKFEKKTDRYNHVIYRELDSELIRRLSSITINPKVIVDAGCGTGFLTTHLSELYPLAEVYGVDFVYYPLKSIKDKVNSKKVNVINADITLLPIASKSVDLLVASMVLHWCEPDLFLEECQRVLKENGVFLFTTLGFNSMPELQQSFIKVDHFPHVHAFMEIAELGDKMLKSGFMNPVVDREELVLSYKDIQEFFRDLKALAATNVHRQRFKGLMTQNKIQHMLKEYSKYKINNEWPVSLEILYGYALGGEKPNKTSYKTNVIPVSSIKKISSHY